jgi:opacity protein-like surface antigen
MNFIRGKGQIMLRKSTLLTALAVLLSAAPAFSQDTRFEAGAFFGWTFADGADGNGVLAQDGNFYNRIDPKDSIKWGLNFGYLATEQAEVGFQFSRQNSKLTVGGTNTRDVGDMGILNYHGYVSYNFGEADTKVRPYVLIGAGATHFPSVPIPATQFQTPSNTKFSTTWGTGVKFHLSPKFGLRVGAQWTPVYLKSDANGWWCDPWYGCYVVGDAQYSNQLDILGGVVFKF